VTVAVDVEYSVKDCESISVVSVLVRIVVLIVDSIIFVD
jgi:hypothetical protein